jgi:two-component system, cell cycle sensor histidine kinase and response regulator CckA
VVPGGRHRWHVAFSGRAFAQRPAAEAPTDAALGRVLFESAYDAVLVATPAGEVLDANAAACAMFGGDAATLRALGRTGLVDPDDPRIDAFLEQRAATGSARAQLRLRRVAGSTFEAELLSHRFATGDGEPRVLLVVRELTELRRLEGLEDGYRSLFHSAYDGIAVFTLDGTIADLNDACAALLGRSREELLGDHFARHVPPEVLAGLQGMFAARLEGDGAGRRYELDLVAADGTRVPVEITSASLLESGRAVGVTCVVRDLRERRAAEWEHAHLEAQLLHAEKLKSLGVLAGGIAHDVNNLLLAVLGHASIARAQLPPGSCAEESLAAIEVGARRCADLANQMLAYAGRGEADLRPVDANEQARELDRLLRASVPRRVELRFDLGEHLPPVLADPAQLRQVLLNLIMNGADAVGSEPGAVTLTTRRRTVGDREEVICVLGDPIEAGEYVELRVDDTGAGMDEETQRRIFEPFFTTKQSGHGLGLAAAAGIVRSHHGAIELRSRPGEGSSFRILLPSVSASECPEPFAPPVAEAGDGVVLVVDDDEQVSSVACRMLEHFGYTPLTATSASEAAELTADNPAIAAALVDLSLPGVGGSDVLEVLREARPELPVVVMSGYGPREAPLPSDVSFIQKPFSADELVRRLQAAIAVEAVR